MSHTLKFDFLVYVNNLLGKGDFLGGRAHVEVPVSKYEDFSYEFMVEVERTLRKGGSAYIFSGVRELFFGQRRFSWGEWRPKPLKKVKKAHKIKKKWRFSAWL